MAQPVLSGELWGKVKEIDGWLTHDEADLLARLCKGTWCEIGSWKGRSTLVLAQNYKGYAIDWFKGNPETEGADTYKDFLFNTRTVKDNIVVIKQKFETAVSQVPPLQLLFLDAEHSYEATKQAFELYEPLVKKGGFIVLHDVWGLGSKRIIGTPYQGVTDYAMGLLADDRFAHHADADRSMALRKL